jgi:hypothetical protein
MDKNACLLSGNEVRVAETPVCIGVAAAADNREPVGDHASGTLTTPVVKNILKCHTMPSSVSSVMSARSLRSPEPVPRTFSPRVITGSGSLPNTAPAECSSRVSLEQAQGTEIPHGPKSMWEPGLIYATPPPLGE